MDGFFRLPLIPVFVAYTLGLYFGHFDFSFLSPYFGLSLLILFGLWILLMVKAYQHEMFRLPIAADVADSIAGKQL